MILMGLHMYVIVLWKCDDHQQKAERQNVVVYFEQEGLFQEQLKDDIMERSRLQQVNTGLSSQLQKTRLKCGNEAKGETTEANCNDHCAKIRDTGVPTDLYWRWYTTGQFPWTACVHKHYEEYRGQVGKPVEEQKDHHNRVSTEDDGPVPRTK